MFCTQKSFSDPNIFLRHRIFFTPEFLFEFSHPKFFPKFFVRLKIYLGKPKLFLKFLFRPIFFFKKSFWTQNLFGHTHFLDPQFFWTQNFLDLKFFVNPTFIWTHNFFRPNICLGIGDFHWRWGIKPFQAEHFRLKSCFYNLWTLRSSQLMLGFKSHEFHEF